MTASFDLSGRVALVTGAGRGLGFEIARAFATAGATVYINGSNAERLEAARERLAQDNVTVTPMAFDVADESAADAALDQIFARHQRLDILVNNVGVRFREPVENITGDDLRNMLNTNLVAAFAISKRSAGLMAKGHYGRIINISSIASQSARRGDLAYIVAKGGMNALTRALAAEFGSYGVTCNAILPGTFMTETNAEMFSTPDMQTWFKGRIPLQRPGQPSEIGGAALFLASPASSFVSGVLLPVDGGFLAAR